MKRQVEAWLHQARLDVKTAEAIIDREDLTRSTVFHCQQCVEKSLKALIENTGERVPKTHNLPRLLGIVEDVYTLKVSEELLQQLNEVYVDSRYPGDAGLVPEGTPSLEKARALLRFAREIHDSTESLLRTAEAQPEA